MTGPMRTRPFDDLSVLPRRRLAAMRQAARELFEVLDAFAREGRHPVRDILSASSDRFTRWSRYPPGDVDDLETGCAWYYHAHDPCEARPWEEHGHFHCYIYTELLPRSAQPIALPPNPDLEKGGLVHLVALSLARSGVPVRLFTINRWASDEWMYAGRDVVPFVDRFTLGGDTPFALTSRWLSATLRVLQPQIAWLLYERDRVLGEHRRVDPEGFSENQSIDVTSTVTFELDAHLAALDRVWQVAAREATRTRNSREAGDSQVDLTDSQCVAGRELPPEDR